MLEQLTQLVQQYGGDAVVNNTAVPNEHNEAVIGETSNSIFAGLDVFENEPKPEMAILMHSKISLTPHIGAATGEAQDRIGTELASQIITLLS